ncbi:MAG: M28 family peptidase [Tannerellaceae bacterium]|jgi:Zn-dependent M28 family amino/carboxypeptidase|nr:M28 family peptidase [Tannerellaceae bacterium]
MKKAKVFPVILACILLSCANKGVGDPPAGTNNQSGTAPGFNADSAYAYVEKQLAFGPRVPNTTAHQRCGDYLIGELKRFAAEVYVQEVTLTAYNGAKLACRNIIGSYNPDAKKRILLFAHWDTRPYADQETDPAKHHIPIDGADDGASGVGALLEIARQLGRQAPAAGVDIIFFDAEDYGVPEFEKATAYTPGSWCLGSQFWAKNPHTPGYRAEYGILLDMVGARHATFYKEQTSMRYAPRIVEKVWSTARDLGYGKFFINAGGGSILDDHQSVIEGRGIPSIDIINYDPENAHGFAGYWHTHKDTIDNIDKETLKGVGQTVLEVIYKEQAL